MTDETSDKCPQCSKKAMPKWKFGSAETGRRCQNCGLVEDKQNDPKIKH